MSPTVKTPLVELSQVSWIKAHRPILQQIDFALYPGEIVSVIGPNGAGKTSLIKLMLGLEKPTSGKIALYPGLRVGYVPQNLQLDPTFPLTVLRFLQLGKFYKPTARHGELEKQLKEVGVHHVMHRPLQAISGGELQRVLLARALLQAPQLLVLDEPAQGVDLMGQSELYDLILKIRKSHQCAILLVSHDLHIVMAQTDRVICLNQHVCCSGRPEEVSRDPAFTALFGKVAGGLAFYTHRHDHQHTVHGEVVVDEHININKEKKHE